MSALQGVSGDHWLSGSGHALANGAGDTFFIDTDLTPSNRPPGTRFAIGEAEFVVTELPQNGFQSFVDGYVRDACVFVMTGEGKRNRLRGIYARVTRHCAVSVGDRVRKLT